MKAESLFARLILVFCSAWLVFFALIPALMLLGISFLSRAEAEFYQWPLTVSNYLALADPLYFKVFFDSFVLAFFTTLICLLVGYPFAWILAALPKKMRALLLILVIIPFWTSSLIRTYALMFLLKSNGLINSGLTFLGLPALEILYTPSAVYIGMVYTLLPFMIMPIYSSVEKLDRTLLQAAADLGATPWQSFVRIALPLTAPGVIAGCMLVFLPALGLFYIPDILGGAKDLVVGSWIKQQFLASRNWPFGAAVSVALVVMMGFLMFLQDRASKRAGDSRS